jgi:hypothetical protein
MSSCRWITDPPIRVGSRYEQVARFLGKEVRTCFEVSALEHGQVVTISSLPGAVQHQPRLPPAENVAGEAARRMSEIESLGKERKVRT